MTRPYCPKRLRAIGLTFCDEAADALESQVRVIAQWKGCDAHQMASINTARDELYRPLNA